MDNSSERMRILEMIENGQISADEGLRQLAELPAAPAPEAGEPGEAAGDDRPAAGGAGLTRQPSPAG